MLIVEVGFKLDKDYKYYDNLLKRNGLNNDFNVITHDIYYTNKKDVKIHIFTRNATVFFNGNNYACVINGNKSNVLCQWCLHECFFWTRCYVCSKRN